MAQDLNVEVKHLTRVEGHGNIYLNAKSGKVEKILWEVDEAPRFFEAFVRGKSYSQLSHVTSRIWGICSYAHSSVTDVRDAEVIWMIPRCSTQGNRECNEGEDNGTDQASSKIGPSR